MSAVAFARQPLWDSRELGLKPSLEVGVSNSVVTALPSRSH